MAFITEPTAWASGTLVNAEGRCTLEARPWTQRGLERLIQAWPFSSDGTCGEHAQSTLAFSSSHVAAECQCGVSPPSRKATYSLFIHSALTCGHCQHHLVSQRASLHPHTATCIMFVCFYLSLCPPALTFDIVNSFDPLCVSDHLIYGDSKSLLVSLRLLPPAGLVLPPAIITYH